MTTPPEDPEKAYRHRMDQAIARLGNRPARARTPEAVVLTERLVLELRAQGYSFDLIGEAVRISPRRVSRIVRAATDGQ